MKTHRFYMFLVVLLLVATTGSAGDATFAGFPVVHVQVDGQPLQTDVPAVNFHGRTVLPVRAVAELAGMQVRWDATTGTAILTSPPDGTAALRQQVEHLEAELVRATAEKEAALDRLRRLEGDASEDDAELLAIATRARQAVVQVWAGEGMGSGWFVQSDGYIVTNAHVVYTDLVAGAEPADDITVRTIDGEELPATLAGADLNHDIALLRVQGSQFAALSLASAPNLTPGDPAVAIGHPEQVGSWVMTLGSFIAMEPTEGALGQESEWMLLTTPTLPGSSGGPVIDGTGRVVGVVTGGTWEEDLDAGIQPYPAVLVRDLRPLQNLGQTTAVPADLVRRVINPLLPAR